MAIGYVHSLESFGSVDGPGVRFVIFLQGCAMRCKYCHNPDSWNMKAGQEWTAADLLAKALRYKSYWGSKGGITVSGGEALLQMEFVTELFTLAKQAGVHTTLDTSGNPFKMEQEYLEKFNKLMDVTDLFMLDIKEMSAEKHKALTGQDNKNILQLATYLSEHDKEMWIRHVLVPELTDDEEGLKGLCQFTESLNTVSRVEILPYHTMGVFKWENLGLDYPLKDYRVPTTEEVKRAEKLLKIAI